MSVEKDIPAVFLDEISPRGLEFIQKCKDFVDNECLPADAIYFSQIDTGDRWTKTPQITEHLKAKAKKLGLWNMFLSKHYADGAGFTNVEYGLMAQYLGRSFVAPEATNTSAPDTGNMEILAKFGSDYQKHKWLNPLLNGDIRSAFLMTEKGTSLSNALNISCSAIKNERGNYVLNGVKWFASGAGDPRCAVWLVMCKTESTEVLHRNHSVLVLDAKKALDSGNARLIRPLSVFGYDDAPHGHCEIEFNNYEISPEEMKNCMLASPGRGFEIIQSRLGPGRIHHCMRLIGAGEFALMRAVNRATNRDIFGKPLLQRESFLNNLTEHKIAIHQCRLMVLNAAHQIDISNAKQAKNDIAMAKIITPRTVLKAMDWAIQMFGAEGVSQDVELAKMYAHARTLRIADGPDEAHIAQLARNDSKKFVEINQYFENHKIQQEKLSKL